MKTSAAKSGLKFGAAVSAQLLLQRPAYGQLVAAECDVIVPENEMKWGRVEQVRGRPDYSAADRIADFAKGSGLLLRGHTAMWYHNIPSWAVTALSGTGGRDVMLERVRNVVGHFRGRVSEWDVVNEAIDHKSKLGNGMREFPPFAPGDYGYIADCFVAAREADPHARLFYNDFGVEYNAEDQNIRRKAALKLVEELKRRSAPLDGFGIQCHLKVGNNFHPGIFRAFLKELAGLGLEISLTEFDVDDRRLPALQPFRNERVAEHAARFLDVALDERAVSKLLTWGVHSGSSWLNNPKTRTDQLQNMALAFYDDFQPTPLCKAIAAALENAPSRH